MDWIVNALTYMYANYAALLGAATTILTLLIGLALIIPGEQPEKALQKILEALKKISKK